MPRKRRFFLPGVPVHVVQRGNNRQAVFFDENDYRAYLEWLSEAAGEHGCSIHAYVLITNHTHLLITPSDEQGLTATLQAYTDVHGRGFQFLLSVRFVFSVAIF